jgi:hypothetical protein
MQMVTMALSTARENTVPIPYSSHLLNSCFVGSKSSHMMKIGPKPTKRARAILFKSNINPAITLGPAMPMPVNQRSRSPLAWASDWMRASFVYSMRRA